MNPKNSTLFVCHEESIIGKLSLTEQGTLEFSYADTWASTDNTFSLSWILDHKKKLNYGHHDTLSFFENLIPEGILREKMSAKSLSEADCVYTLLEEHGQDCAGALSISRNQPLKDLPVSNELIEVPIDIIEDALNRRIPLPEILEEDGRGYFSLAGAQNKVALIIKDGKLFKPKMNAATTHILKGPVYTYKSTEDSVWNEFFCMNLARLCGLIVPDVKIIHQTIPILCVTRYDRKIFEDKTIRLHQLDICQSLGYKSSQKYQRLGGPSFKQIFDHIRGHAQKPIAPLNQMLDWLSFNLIIGNNDCHAKNISYLFTNQKPQLAPFYDLLSTAIYSEIKYYFAFTIDGCEDITHLRPEHIENLEKQLSIRNGLFLRSIRAMAAKIEEELKRVMDAHGNMIEGLKTFRKIAEVVEKRIHILRHQGVLAQS